MNSPHIKTRDGPTWELGGARAPVNFWKNYVNMRIYLEKLLYFKLCTLQIESWTGTCWSRECFPCLRPRFESIYCHFKHFFNLKTSAFALEIESWMGHAGHRSVFPAWDPDSNTSIVILKHFFGFKTFVLHLQIESWTGARLWRECFPYLRPGFESIYCHFKHLFGFKTSVLHFKVKVKKANDPTQYPLVVIENFIDIFIKIMVPPLSSNSRFASD